MLLKKSLGYEIVCLLNNGISKTENIHDNKDAKTAPSAPCFGIKIKFKTILNSKVKAE